MKEKQKRSAASWIWEFAGKFRPKYVLSVLSAVCGVICGILPYFVMAQIIGDLLGGCKEVSVYLENCLIMAALWGGRCAFHSISTTLSHKATFAVLGNIRKRVCEKLFRVPLGTVLDMPSGTLKNVLVERIDSIETTMAHIIPEFTSNLLVPIALLIAEVKSYNLTGEKSKALNEAIDDNTQTSVKTEMTFVPVMFLQSLVSKLIGVAVAATSVAFYLNGTMELLNAVVMIISAFILFGALDSAGSYSAMLKNVDLCVSKAQSVLTMPTMDTDGRDIKPSNYDIDVENVEFSYDERKIIDGVSVHIPEKTTTAIVGPSGGGKTTLCHLIARFWDVDKGNIKLGGHNVKESRFFLQR